MALATDEPTAGTVGAKGARRLTRRRQRREWPHRLAVVLLALLGIVVTLLPVAGTYYNNWHAQQFANRTVNQQDGSPQANAEWLARARAYNRALPQGAVRDPWSGQKPNAADPDYRNYLAQLAGTDAMARLRIPSIKVTLPVYHGTTEQSLQHGAGHMYGTSLPVGGAGSHAALAAHRGLPTMTGFDQLPAMTTGDQFFVDVFGETLAYRVSKVQTVLPDDTKPLTRVPDRDQVTLITCTPYGINSHRLLVTGDRIPLSQANQAQAQWHQDFDWTVQRWMYPRLGIALATLLVLLGMAALWIRDDRRRRRRPSGRRHGRPTPHTDLDLA